MEIIDLLKMVAISVIVPVYNVEKYLGKCIDSVLAQSFRDFEVILVDDGSTDGSGSICDEYSNLDNRIKVIHKVNGGIVSARKAGFKVSNGKYIANIDSDDWLEPNHLQTLYDAIKYNKADIAQNDYYINEDKECVNKPSSIIPNIVVLDCLDGSIHSGLWCKLIERSLYEKKGFQFPPCDFTDDLHTTISLLINANNYCYIPKATYHYRMNGASVTHEQSVKSKIRKYSESMTNLEDLYYRLGIKDNIKMRKKLLGRVNTMKRDLVKFYPDIEGVKKMLDFFPKSFSITEIHTVGDFFYYLACNWKILTPYKLKKYLK